MLVVDTDTLHAYCWHVRRFDRSPDQPATVNAPFMNRGKFGHSHISYAVAHNKVPVLGWDAHTTPWVPLQNNTTGAQQALTKSKVQASGTSKPWLRCIEATGCRCETICPLAFSRR